MKIEDIKPAWLIAAESYIGTTEIAGEKDNATIVHFHEFTDLKAQDDETPWCASFVNACLVKGGKKGTVKANARSFLGWGTEIKYPPLGAIVVTYRGNPNGPAGHVGFYYGIENGLVKILGGNQKDSVCVLKFAPEKILGFRWPTGD